MDEAAIVFDMLPASGESIGFEALRAALSGHLGREIEREHLFRLITLLQNDPAPARAVRWTPETRELRRGSLAGGRSLPETIVREVDLEPWFEQFLWIDYSGFYDWKPQALSAVVENTARKSTGAGRWTRPDISMACVAHFRFTIGSQLDLYSFELKLSSGCTVVSVHEALAHGAASHHSYLVLHLPRGSDGEAHLPGVLSEAQRHGVGLIRVCDHRDMRAYQRLLHARRHNLPPGRLDEVISARFNAVNQSALERWVRVR